ncbi:DNA-directed RNA polymerase II subunit 4-like [Ziziphus jujuba]|uniref:DNA-directed RNA polymerase II subunit 4-like n=1 Tax=Ziziphus jujuba TaxID=326968 RepID=A0ABM4A2T9_ZIZJJ|nr:DNA-directed RNA polymerase II subunit 4-like [Ziziphus jujuba]
MKNVKEEEEDASVLKPGDDFSKAKCPMNCEVSILLVHRCDQLKHMSDDSLKQLPQVFEKVLQYVKRFSHFTNQDAVKQVREYPSFLIIFLSHIAI